MGWVAQTDESECTCVVALRGADGSTLDACHHPGSPVRAFIHGHGEADLPPLPLELLRSLAERVTEVCVYTYAHTHTHTQVRLALCACACLCVCIYTLHTHTHTHTLYTHTHCTHTHTVHTHTPTPTHTQVRSAGGTGSITIAGYSQGGLAALACALWHEFSKVLYTKTFA